MGQAIFDNAMLKSLRDKGKTILLVTHALHVLPLVDYIYTIDGGSIVEEGTYYGLVDKKGPFSRLVQEYGGAKSNAKEVDIDLEEDAVDEGPSRVAINRNEKERAVDKAAASLAAGSGKLEGRLIAQEKRNTGKISFGVYKQYFLSGKGWTTMPLILASSLVMQGKLEIRREPIRPQLSVFIGYRCSGYGWSLVWLFRGRNWQTLTVSQAYLLGEQYF